MLLLFKTFTAQVCIEEEKHCVPVVPSPLARGIVIQFPSGYINTMIAVFRVLLIVYKGRFSTCAQQWAQIPYLTQNTFHLLDHSSAAFFNYINDIDVAAKSRHKGPNWVIISTVLGIGGN